MQKMKTKRLIEYLADSATAIDPHEIRNRFAYAMSCGLLSSTVLLITLLGIRADISTAILTYTFWAKLLFSFSVMAGGLFVASRLSQPGQSVRGAWFGIIVPLSCIAAALVIELYHSPNGTLWSLVSDRLWRSCPLDIAALSLPGLGALLHAMKRLAPTHLNLAGAVAGLIAGATAAFVYCLHCPETELVFWAARYVLGIAISAAIGAILGPSLLRW
ncbi:DUF1109 domain-containing protein [Pseudomonas sp. Pseu.R1]|uniref:DUF1109 domain-containing protein n=1 Tax=Pseudomonas sp. Pseu.R1 TaxID=3379818 RepID=UPI003B94DD6E